MQEYEFFQECQSPPVFIHLAQLVYRKIQNDDLTEAYNSEDRQLKTEIHMALSLAFIPSTNIK